jgi:DNA-binding NtrC family response regulator
MSLYNKLREMKIMLIDDDEWIRDSLSFLFHGEGCSLDTYESAEEGINALKERDYDIIIADYFLPGMDGLKFFARIHESHGRIIKILITAYGNNDVISAAHELGIHALIKKPFTTKTFEESLSRLLDNGI